jgi:hypothetical protein
MENPPYWRESLWHYVWNTLMIQAKAKKDKRGREENFAKTIEKSRKNRRLG